MQRPARDQRWDVRPAGSTWGDFGPDDQRGRLNLVTPERLLAAIGEVRAGRSFCLSLPLTYPGGTVLSPFRKPPEVRPETLPDGRLAFNAAARETHPGATDLFSDQTVRLSLQYSTHWDGLAHIGQFFDADADGTPEDVCYNGFPAELHQDGGGARHLTVENMGSVQGRGVMIDIAAHFGRSGQPFGYEELMLVLDRDRVTVSAGDFVCLRTGFADLLLEMRGKPDRDVLFGTTSALDGRDPRLKQWITETGIVALAADNYAVEALPARPSDEPCCASLPLHEHCLFRLGVYLGELWYLGELADWLRAHDRSRFLLTAPPLRLPGAVASPTTPVATV